MIIDENFIKEFDKLSNIEKAKDIANSLGYYQGYCDLGTEEEIEEDYYNRINKLLGTKSEEEWPDSVKEALKEGYKEGWEDLQVMQN